MSNSQESSQRVHYPAKERMGKKLHSAQEIGWVFQTQQRLHTTQTQSLPTPNIPIQSRMPPRRTQLQPVRKVNGRLSPLDTSPGKRGVQRKPVNMQSTQKITHLRHESFPLEETKIRRVHVSALYCISMQLTLDYRERTKGQPKAPKAQTLHHCTGQRPCEQFFHSTQRVQGSPFTNRRQPAGEPQIPESLRRQLGNIAIKPDHKTQATQGCSQRPARPLL